ncbi:MAG: putative glucose-6-phosphate isomerase [Parcubacteria group bacterium GW2011_GWA2_47_8]|nr:MAG: putative glucose-6-phosphate isomerase [Parcubacteria group bacterium GW2011_GWA2_47_8]OHB18719.1 MAG: hypothetical protein A2666_02585 [Parcubacteria group bacterium RIFCSPHIGHO2_01_FULL_47_10b]
MLHFSTEPIDLGKSTIARAIQSQEAYTRRLRNCCHDFEYACNEASVTLPGDEPYQQLIYSIIDKKRTIGIDKIIVEGIGNADLSVRAIYEAVGTRSTLEGKAFTPIRFLDTVDPLRTELANRTLKAELGRGRNILLNVVSKSGNTTETIANFELLLQVYREARPHDWHELVVVTTGRNSPLWKAARSIGIDILPVYEKVGGRYGALSSVSLFPLGLAHVDVVSLLNGAREARDTYLYAKKPSHNLPLASAATLFAATKRKKPIYIHDTFLFAKDLEYLGRWYRQLLAESIGKEHDRKGKRVETGLLPTVSIGSTDLHSRAQLYLGGPSHSITTFVTLNNWPVDPAVPADTNPNDPYPSIVPHIRGKTFAQLMSAITQGTQGAYKKQKRPYMHIQFDHLDEHHIGAFMQFKMLEVMYLGNMLNINAFDQPHVELYKAITREVLAKGMPTTPAAS